jgi:hypothetical protein
MKTTFVNLKSELTLYKVFMEGDETKEVYRTRLNCLCPDNNRRNGLLVLQKNVLKYKVIRCRACTRREAEHGNI